MANFARIAVRSRNHSTSSGTNFSLCGWVGPNEGVLGRPS